jgi:hypothetical protein
VRIKICSLLIYGVVPLDEPVPEVSKNQGQELLDSEVKTAIIRNVGEILAKRYNVTFPNNRNFSNIALRL